MQHDDRTVSLDGLRGLAALMVVASHASGLGLNLIPGLALTGIGKYGVYLFFVLSAFLLTTQWLRAFEAERVDGHYLRRYLLRRVLRIYPLYALVLVIGLALAPRGLGVPLDAAALWRHLRLQEGRGLYWSIPVEFLYYLCIPPLAWLLSRPWPYVVRLFALVGLLATASLVYPAALTPANSSALGYYLSVFISGSAAAWFALDRENKPLHYWSVFDALAVLSILLSIPQVFQAAGWFADVDALHRLHLAWGLAWSAMLIGVLQGRMPLWRKLLATGFWRSCGHWCFGIYLLHMPALYAVRKLPMPGVFQAWLGLGLSLALAGLAHKLIEAPAIRFGHRV